MDRYAGRVEKLRKVDVGPLRKWLDQIPLGCWPAGRMSQSCDLPTMIVDPWWQGFGGKTQPLIDEIMGEFPYCKEDTPYLSMLVPGQKVRLHNDVQSPGWRCRIHVPIETNDGCWMEYENDSRFHMDVGWAWKVNTEIPHRVYNQGNTNRVHLFFDVKEF